MAAPAAAPPGGRLRSLGKNLLAMGLGLALAWGLAEAVLSFLVPPPLIYRSPQPRHAPHPRLGWLLQPGQEAFTIDQPVRVNRLGFRSPEIRPDDPATYRILCVGDSQTYGNGVAQDSIFTARLQELLAKDIPGVEVINGGMQGYDTLQEVRLVEEFAPQLHPDVVVLAFYLNDLAGSLRSDPTRHAKVDAETGQTRRRGLVKSLTPYPLIYLAKRSRLVSLIYWRYRQLRQGGTADPTSDVLTGTPSEAIEQSWKIISDALRRLRDLGAEHRFQVIVFPIPAASEFVADFPDSQYRPRFLSIAAELGLRHFDPTPEMQRLGGGFGPFFIAWDGHINARTHALVAAMLASEIRAGLPGTARPD